jgi:hypothetical protein
MKQSKKSLTKLAGLRPGKSISPTPFRFRIGMFLEEKPGPAPAYLWTVGSVTKPESPKLQA